MAQKKCIDVKLEDVDSLESYNALYGSDKQKESLEKKRKALEMALDTRKFEITLYWERAKYFWAFIALTFGAYFLLFKEFDIKEKNLNFYNEALLGISLFGVFVSICWFFVNKGAKYWQENWEKHVDLLEDEFMGPLYKTTADNPSSKYESLNPFKSYRYSVGKINLYLSFSVVLIWLIIVFNRLSIIFHWPEKWEYFNEIATVVGFGILIFVCWMNCRSTFSNGSKEFTMKKRVLESKKNESTEQG